MTQSLSHIAAEALLEAFQPEEKQEPEAPQNKTPMVLLDLNETFGLFAQGSAHKRALPHLIQKSSRRFALEPTKVVYYTEEDGSRFFDGSQTHLECLMVLVSSALIDLPKKVQAWQEVGPNGKPRMNNGKPVVRKPRLAGLKLDGFNFAGIHFVGVDFYGATGKGVNFEGCTFENCRINNTAFTNSNFRNAKFVKMSGRRNNQGSLRWIDLRGSDVSFADFSGADIREANFSGSKAQGADFRGANAIATRWYGVTGAPIVEEGALHGESKFSFEMRGALREDDMVTCHKLPESIAAGEWRNISEDQRQRLVNARLVEKQDNAEEWNLTDTAVQLRKVG